MFWPMVAFMRSDAGDDVGGAAWREGHDQAHRLVGIGLRAGGQGQRGAGRSGQQRTKVLSTIHGLRFLR
jgi:hypothetical protein